VMLAVHNSKSYKVLSSPTCLEVLSVNIGLSSPIVYCLVYVPPNCSEEYLIEFFKYLQSLNSSTNSLLLLGDFNFSDINWDSMCGLSPLSAKFCDIIFNLNLFQLISEPTHIAGNILDLILTNIPDHIFNVNVHCEPPLLIPSDHYIITFNVQTLNYEVNNRVTTSFDFTKGNYEGLCHFLSNCDFSPCFESVDIEFAWCYISGFIKEGMKQFVPVITVNCKNQPKWFNSSIRHNINCVRTLRHNVTEIPLNRTNSNLKTMKLYSNISKKYFRMMIPF